MGNGRLQIRFCGVARRTSRQSQQKQQSIQTQTIFRYGFFRLSPAYKFILAPIYDLAKKLAYTHFPFSCEIIVFARRDSAESPCQLFGFVVAPPQNSNTCHAPGPRHIIFVLQQSMCVAGCGILFTKKHLCRPRLLDIPEKHSRRAGHPHRSLNKSASEL